MTEITGTTIAAVRESANKVIGQMRSELEEKRKELDEVKAALDNKTKEDDDHKAEIDLLKEEVENLKSLANADKGEAEASNSVDPEKDGLIEVVAVPFNSEVRVPQLDHNGKTALMERDEDGFYHFWVERDHAALLLSSNSGLKFVLVGPDATIKVNRMFGVRSEEAVVYRHAKIKTTSGTVVWQPVIEEESRD